MLCLAILLPLIAMAGGKADLMKVQTVWNDGQYVGNSAPVFAAPRETPTHPAGSFDAPGKIDTVGGTTYDWQINGSSDQFIVVDPTYGVHVTWMYSAEMSGHADRNMRYNFFDFAGGAWNFIDPTNFMNSGVNAFTDRSGFGMLDVNPVTGVAYIVAHQGSAPIHTNVARDAAPGAGIFDPCTGTPNGDNYLWPSLNLTANEKVHAAICDDPGRNGCFYSAVDPWCTWSVPISLPNGQVPDPQFPTYILKGSKSPSGKVVVTWDYSNPDAASPDECYYRVSDDNGATWADPVQVPLPPAFTPGSETLATFHIGGIYPFLDHADNMHIVANIGPIIAGSGYIIPCEIWHWYQPNGLWTKIFRASTDTLSAAVGYNSLYASRPTLGEGDPNELVCIWEEFDSLNAEPTTSLLRAEIRGARSLDNGETWGNPVTITDPGTSSKRIPSIAPKIYNDTIWVRYEDDQCAGYGIAPYAQGPITNNPIIVHRMVKTVFPATGAVAENPIPTPSRLASSAYPNPFYRGTVISYDLPRAGNVSLTVYDAAGRPVKTLVNGHASPGSFTASWDGRSNDGTSVASGIYFYTLATEGSKLTRKLTLLQ
jgi:hypothetical protein